MQLPPGWTPQDAVATSFAVLSFALSLFQQYQRWRDRRPEVIVEARIAPAQNAGDDVPRLHIDVRNRSDRIIYLSHVAISSPESIFKHLWWKGPARTWAVAEWPQQTALTYPVELQPGKAITDILSPWQVADFLSQKGNRGTARFQGCLRDEMGHMYRSKPRKLELDQWLLPRAHVSAPLFRPAVDVPVGTVLTPMYSPSADQDADGQ